MEARCLHYRPAGFQDWTSKLNEWKFFTLMSFVEKNPAIFCYYINRFVDWISRGVSCPDALLVALFLTFHHFKEKFLFFVREQFDPGGEVSWQLACDEIRFKPYCTPEELPAILGLHQVTFDRFYIYNFGSRNGRSNKISLTVELML